MPVRREFAITAAAVAAAGVLVAGVTAVSNASTTSQVAAGTGYARGAEGDGSSDDPGMGRGPGGHGHTEVTGDELARVTAAVKAQDSSITVDTVRKDPDGSYDVLGTKDGNPVMVEVSKDLEAIETRLGRELEAIAIAAHRSEQAAHLGQCRAAGLLHAPERIPVLGERIGELVPDGADLEHHHADGVRDDVVQLASDSRPLLCHRDAGGRLALPLGLARAFFSRLGLLRPLP